MLFLLKEFVKDKRYLWTFGVVAVLCSLLYFILFQKQDLIVFPNRAMKAAFYTDKDNKGNSYLTNTVAQDSLIQMDFVLKAGYVAPYAGLHLSQINGRMIDVSNYNRIEVEITAKNINDLIVYLAVKDNHVKDTMHVLAERHIGENIEMVSGKKHFHLPFKTFKTAYWWYTAIGQPQSDFSEPEWNRLVRVVFATGLNPRLDAPSTLYVHSIRFYRDNFATVICMVIFQFVLMAFLFLGFCLKRRKRGKIVSLNISYTAIPIAEKKKSGYDFLDYIHEHFIDPELSLAQISHQTGINQRLISDTISEKFHCNFKTYVNQIRINEAKRLLKETELNISEIAYKVGFSSPGSFNRVFKTLTGSTPSEYFQHPEN